jgi:phage shock protein C
MNRRLYRSHTDKVIGGVAGGVAEYLDLDPAIVRVVWALLALLTGGVFFLLYIVMWIVVPVNPEVAVAGAEAGGEPSAPGAPGAPLYRHRRHGSGTSGLVFGLILIGLGSYFLLREYVTWLDVDRLWPLGLVGIGLVLLVVAIRRPPA